MHALSPLPVPPLSLQPPLSARLAQTYHERVAQQVEQFAARDEEEVEAARSCATCLQRRSTFCHSTCMLASVTTHGTTRSSAASPCAASATISFASLSRSAHRRAAGGAGSGGSADGSADGSTLGSAHGIGSLQACRGPTHRTPSLQPPNLPRLARGSFRDDLARRRMPQMQPAAAATGGLSCLDQVRLELHLRPPLLLPLCRCRCSTRLRRRRRAGPRHTRSCVGRARVRYLRQISRACGCGRAGVGGWARACAWMEQGLVRQGHVMCGDESSIRHAMSSVYASLSSVCVSCMYAPLSSVCARAPTERYTISEISQHVLSPPPSTSPIPARSHWHRLYLLLSLSSLSTHTPSPTARKLWRMLSLWQQTEIGLQLRGEGAIEARRQTLM